MPASPTPLVAAAPDWQGAFAEALRPLLAEVRAGLRVPAGLPADREALCRDVTGQLAGRLVRQAARTFVTELHRHRRAGRLSGATPADRFDFFVRWLAADGLGEILASHPVLGRMFADACRQSIEVHRELLERLAADRPSIVSGLLGADPGPLVGVRAGGDAHHGGRAVSVLSFATGARLVYRPRPVRLYQRFARTVTWLNERMDAPGLRTVEVLDRDRYGWLGHIGHRPCTDIDQVRRFYLRQGALLALLYVLDGTDMHFENLVADGEHPVLIDVETLFHPRFGTPGLDPAADAIARSVCRTALLPLQVWGELGAVDLSGLGGDEGARLVVQVADWADPGTETMRLIRRPAVTPAGHNRPRLHSRVVEPRDHLPALLAGFTAGYDAIAAHRGDLGGPDGLLRRFADVEVRVVPRATHRYTSLLDESTHPTLLRDPATRDAFLATLRDDDSPLIEHELADLRHGDVPAFTTRPDDRALWTSGGIRVPGILAEPGLAAVEAKLAVLGEVDRSTQRLLITAALATRAPDRPHQPSAACPGPVVSIAPDPHRLLAAACGIADDIIGRAEVAEGRANWITLEPVEDRQWNLLPMGAGLPYGYVGTALALAQLGTLTGADRYTEVARQALRPLPRLLETIAAAPELAAVVGVGLHGLGGICYALSRLGALVEPGCLDAGLAALAAVPGDSPLSYADGLAGAVTALLAVDDPAAARLADDYADRLRAGAAAGAAPGGFAHGGHGIGYALLRYGEQRADGQFLAAGRRLIDSAGAPAGFGSAGVPAGFGSAAGPVGVPGDLGWCRGEAGAVIARLAAGADTGPYVAASATRPPRADLSLCHGELGTVEALLPARRAGVPGAAAAVEHRSRLLLGALKQYGPTGATPDGVTTAGLFDGLAGIAYGLVRLAFPDAVPSVLLLEADRPSLREQLN